VVTFIVPRTVDELYLAVCLSGVLNRSESGDSLLVGRKEFPIEEATNFIIGNYKDFVEQKVNNKIDICSQDLKLASEAKKAYLSSGKTANNKGFIDWVKTNKDKLHNIRHSISDLTSEIACIIDKTSRGENLVLSDGLSYVGLAVQDADRIILIDFIKKHNTIIDYSKTIECAFYCIVQFEGGKDKLCCKPLDSVSATIDALVIRKGDGVCAFRIRANSLILNNVPIVVNQLPYITGIIPYKEYKEKPTMSSSSQFAGMSADTVCIIPMDYSLVLTGFYA
jgi:hypothetical protein